MPWVKKIIRETYQEKAVCVTAFIDLKGAYDGVNHWILLRKLKTIGMQGRMLAFCKFFSKNRQFQVLYNGEFSEIKSAAVGVPQGAPISPLLFNIFISDIIIYLKYTESQGQNMWMMLPS
jgi:retron-type reverse transcriptase